MNALITLAIAATLTALHPGHAHTILGTITATPAGQVEVLDKNNEKTVFAITKDTRILIGKAAGTAKDLKDRKSTRLNSSHIQKSRMPSSA